MMNKKLSLLFTLIVLSLLLSGPIVASEANVSLNSSSWTSQKVGNVNFKIPPKYENGHIENPDYFVITNIFVFAIRYIDSYSFLKSSYGDDVSSSDTVYVENQFIADHAASVIYQEKNIDRKEYNVTYVYFPVKDEIYCISYSGDNLTPEVEEMIKNTPRQNISNEDFYGRLLSAKNDYIKESNDYNNNYNDYYSYSNRNNHKHRDWFGYYFAYNIGRHSRY